MTAGKNDNQVGNFAKKITKLKVKGGISRTAKL